MYYKEIIDTIEVGDYVEVKGSAVVDDGIHFVQMTTFGDEKQTLCINGSWPYNKHIVRKVSLGEVVKNIEEQTTEAQDSQNENDSSQKGGEIVVGSKWEFIGEYNGFFIPGKVYTVKYSDLIEVYFVDEEGDNHYFTTNTLSDYFTPAEQSTDTLKEQLASEEVSGGVLKILKGREESEADTIISLQYDPKDVAFTSESFQSDKLTKHYDFFYTLTEDDVEAGSLKLDPYFVSQQWKLGKKDDTGVLFHCLKTLARFGDKNDIEREIKALNVQVKRLAELHNVKL